MSVALQSPLESLDYSHDYSEDLDASGSPSDTISSVAWTWLQNPDDGSSPSPEIYDETTSGSIATAWVRNLQVGSVYVLAHTMITAAGRTFSHEWVIRCGYR